MNPGACLIDRLGLRSDADVFAYYAKTRFDTLCRYYARGFRHIIPALCRNFLKRRAWRDDDPKDEEYSEPVLEFPTIWVRRRCKIGSSTRDSTIVLEVVLVVLDYYR